MSCIERLHGQYIYTRRVRVLCDHFVGLIPRHSCLLDVGCGDGLLGRLIMERLPGVELKGLDTLVRRQTHIPVEGFDGQVIPYQDDSFDLAMLVDVLHHTEAPMRLLGEAARVAREAILIKDHISQGILDALTLRVMDWTGNARHGVPLPYTYWSKQRWLEAFDKLGLTINVWTQDLGLYPGAINWIVGRSLHFVTMLNVSTQRRRNPVP